MGVSAVPSQTVSERRDGLFTARPTIYIVILLSAFIPSFIYQFRVDNIFRCPATGYSSDRFLTHCEVPNYGDYEHGAFWFDLEPAAQISAASSDVLFLGNSREQYAFSTPATAQWFSSASASYYLLGFIHFENSIFERALLRKLKPRAEVYVVNLPDFFQKSEAPVAKIVLHDDAARTRYQVKRLLQFVHKLICMNVPKICGHAHVVYQSRLTGTWYVPEINNFKGHERPVSYEQQIDEREIDDAIAIGRVFLSELPVKSECVILTAVPTVGTKLRAVNAIAGGLGKTLVLPEHLDGLQTFDGSHLDPVSAERWSDAFFKAAGPQIQKCLGAPSHDTLRQDDKR